MHSIRRKKGAQGIISDTITHQEFGFSFTNNFTNYYIKYEKVGARA